MLCVEFSLPGVSAEEVLRVVSGVKATIRIADSAGNTVLQQNLTADSFSLTWPGQKTRQQPVPVFRFTPVPPGEYKLFLNVQQPASQLADIPHRVVANYELCGIERMATQFTGGFSAVCLLIGGGIFVTIFVTANKPRSQSVTKLADNLTY